MRERRDRITVRKTDREKDLMQERQAEKERLTEGEKPPERD